MLQLTIMKITVRPATHDDIEFLVRGNKEMAHETENLALDIDRLRRGVHAVFDDPSRGFYLIAEINSTRAGQMMITYEWSDWRNGAFWWIQSVYVRPEFRRLGVYTRLYRYVRSLAAKSGSVCGFRLYVERDNRRAQKTYRRAGMHLTHYLMYEALKPGVRFFTPAAGAAAPSSRRRRARTARRTRS